MGFARERADLRQQLRGHAYAFTRGTRAIRKAPVSGKAHGGILRHRRDERLDALEEDVVTREGARIHRKERLPDARGPALVGEETVGLETEGRAGASATVVAVLGVDGRKKMRRARSLE